MLHHYDLMLCLEGGEVQTYPDTEVAAALQRAYQLKNESPDSVVSLVILESAERVLALQALERLGEAMASESEDLHADVESVLTDLRVGLDAARLGNR